MGLRRHLILLVVCLLGSARWAEPAGAADGCAPPDRPVGWIVSVQGQVEVRAEPGAPWRLARPDETLCSRAILQVGDRSRARIALANAPVSLDENTTLHLVGGPELIRAAEAEQPALIRLLQGALYVFSREPHALTINTPFVNASIEGTEFLARVEAGRAQVSVFEGVVAARNPYGEVRVESGQSAVAEAGKAPVPVIIARPRDAVAWALHYASVLLPLTDPKAAADLPEAVREALLLAGRGDLASAFARLDRTPEAERGPQFHLYRAALLLSVGRVDEARADLDQALLQDPAAGVAYALRTVIAVAQNDKAGAFADARRAVELSPHEAAPKIALSYAQQAHFELEAARDALLQAVKDEPKNALAWARLSELWLMLGYRDRAREAAETAVGLAPQLERTQTVLGFAALAEFRTRAAKTTFERAIALNTAAPLPRFGLGLAKIRRGDLEEGRQDIEIAVALDPASALLRSYLGKAYFEERREEAAGEQFAIAKELDPLDPTPYFYDALRKQSENRPVEALRDAETAIRLNENRAVFRSRELLDQDRAARGASLGRIYTDLGFEQLGINEAAKSLALDPANAAAHRFLSDLYAFGPFQRGEISRVSELLQAQLLQDININPVQPSLAESNLNVFARGGPARPGFNEFTPLFERNQVQLNLSGEAGSNDTFADEAVVSGLYNRFSASAGQFHYQTDGFRENFDIQHNVYNLFAQAAVTPEFNVQAEFRRRRSEKGDLQLTLNPAAFSEDLRNDLRQDIGRVGFRFSPTPLSHVIGSVIYSDREEENESDVMLDRVKDESLQGEIEHILQRASFNIITGIGGYNTDRTSTNIRNFPFGTFDLSPPESEIKHLFGYLYSNLQVGNNALLTLGLSVDDYNQDSIDSEKLNPKIGLQWNLTDRIRLRAAAFRTVNPLLAANRTVQPTQVAGFNQFFDDVNGTTAWRYGLGIDARITPNVLGGIEVSARDLSAPGGTSSVLGDEWRENLYRAYLYWTPYRDLALSSDLQVEVFESDMATPAVRKVETWSLPISAFYFHSSGFFAGALLQLVHQEVDSRPGSGFEEGSSDFAVVDGIVGYRFPRRYGMFSVEAKNLFNSNFEFQDKSFISPSTERAIISPFIPERTVLARLTLNF